MNDLSTHRLIVCLMFYAVLSTGSVSAQVQLDRFYPPVVSIAGETEVTAEGKFPVWPVEIVCDRDDIKIVALDTSGKMQVAVPEDAVPGVAWVRVHDKTSASSLIPLLIEPLAALLEVEPNNSNGDAMKLDLPCLLVGRLEKSGDVDTYRLAVRGGETLVVSATAHRILRSPMDTILQLVDPQGNVLMQSDDVRGLDPQLVYVAPNDAELLVRVFAFPETPTGTIGYAGSASFVYSLGVTSGAFVDHVLPLLVTPGDTLTTQPFGWNLPAKWEGRTHVPANTSPPITYATDALGWQLHRHQRGTAAQLLENRTNEKDAPQVTAMFPGEAQLPYVFSGHIDQPGEVDRLRFHVQQGKKYRVAVHSRQFGFTLDSVLRLIDTKDDSELARNDDQSRNQYDAAIEYSAKTDSEVELQISDLLDAFGPRHAYSVVIEEAKPAVALSVVDDHFAVKAGESLEIVVTVSRLHGFKEKLRVSVDQLPAGITSETVVSENKGDSSKSVKLKIIADKNASFQGTFQVVGHVLDAEDKPTSESFTAAYRLRDIVEVNELWLSVAPDKP